MKIIKCYIYSTVIHDSETWTINTQLESRTTAQEMWIYRRKGHFMETKTFLERLGMERELMTETDE